MCYFGIDIGDYPKVDRFVLAARDTNYIEVFMFAQFFSSLNLNLVQT